MNRELVHLSGPALASTLGAGSIVVLPTGAIEHHGPHLPLSTDWLMADLISAAIVDEAASAGQDVWILPALAYTKSDEHFWAPGTVWLNATTLLDTVVDIGRSIAATPAKTLVFYNGHGGNIALLQVALREIRRRFGLRTFLMGPTIPSGDGVRGADGGPGLSGPDEHGFGVHGGHSETSMILHLRPDLVDLSRASRWVPPHMESLQHVKFNGGPVHFGWLSNDFGPAGVVGDASGATAAWGATLFRRSVDAGVAALAEIAAFDHPALPGTEPLHGVVDTAPLLDVPPSSP
ncbi:creatininase family protein [Frondihabitans australicus]|uniref:Creatinine amidohydrolase n=1 Tax=Frondihabitans australicus TaxID=386892 RepID=A0A495ILJ8_9MICO|nr:creatininase family protein [Frondihabitans australicus]RKR76005.1 creatinine amidohydrolase [Frondihabitans australicus]